MIISHLILGMVYGAETNKWIHMVYGIGFTTVFVSVYQCIGAFLVDKQTHPLVQQTHSRNLSGQNLQIQAARDPIHFPSARASGFADSGCCACFGSWPIWLKYVRNDIPVANLL
jgi:hypothetical protein